MADSVPALPRMRRANLKRPPPNGVTSANWISSPPISARFAPADIASSSQLVSHAVVVVARMQRLDMCDLLPTKRVQSAKARCLATRLVEIRDGPAALIRDDAHPLRPEEAKL